ncbi:ABC transporter permease [Micrococcus luteus]|uniref:FtsX-like permease family protein n=1 Tax=Micrococcus luteus TaxID=1270 RepID=UPI003C2BC81C
MWTVALSQLRTQPRRYVSLVLAILIGTLFLAASFLVSSTAQATLRATLGSTYAGADLVVLPGGSEDVSDLAGTGAEPGPLARLDGVEEAYALRMAWATARAADAEFGTTVMPLPRDPALAGLTVTAGTLPAADDARGVTLDAQTADRHGVAVGDVVTLAGESGPAPATTPLDAVVTGLTQPSPDPMLSGQAQVWASSAALTAVQGQDGEAGFTPHLLLRLADGADVPAVAEAAAAGVDVDVATPDEAVRSAVTQLSGGTDLLGWVLGGFAALALLVTALVIANTFQVLVAQRTRDLALLRTIGSTTAQVRASVLTEAAVVGVVGSVLGAGLAVAIVAGVAAAARAMLDLPFLTFGLHPAGLAVLVAVGVAVTVLAALAPAVAATRVAPLEALRPKDEVTAGSRGGRVRTAIGLMLALGGTALMLWGVSTREPVSAIGGGALSFVGVLLLARLFVPAAVRGAAVLARPAGVPGRLAGLNAVRHRSRTAATAAALLVGTTLVALFLIGGRTAQEQTALALDTAYPVDIVVQLPADADPAHAAEAVAATADVQAVALATPVGATENGSPVLATPAADLRAVVARLPEGVTGLGDPGTALVPDWVDADQVRAEVAGAERTFVPVRAGSLSSGVYVAAEPLRETGWDGAAGAAVPGQLLVALDPGVPVDRLQGLSEDVTRAAGAGAAVIDGGAGERALYARIIDAMLGIVVALLAVSVLIALIGVANTLSLSVIERTRENALLRALGLTRGGLRGAIAIEAVLIAVVAAVLGCALGVCYGWAGAQLVLADLSATAGAGTAVRPAVPWLELVLVVAVAALAGLAASLLPARRAARLSPVAGLAAV